MSVCVWGALVSPLLRCVDDLSISCDRPCLELQNASLSFDIDCFFISEVNLSKVAYQIVHFPNNTQGCIGYFC